MCGTESFLSEAKYFFLDKILVFINLGKLKKEHFYSY